MMLKQQYQKALPNTCFNLINPLSWFLHEDHAKTTPSLRIVATQRSSGADLKVKPMLDASCRRLNETCISSANPLR